MKKPSLILQVALAASLMLTACNSVQERMDSKLPEVEEKWQGAFGIAYNGHERIDFPSWDEAIDRILESNHHIKESISDAYFTEKECGMVYRRMLPELVFAATFNKSLKELDNIGADDVFLVANGFLQLPNPIEVRAKMLSAQLQYLRSSIGGQLLLREYHAKLFRLHRGSLKLEQKATELAGLQNLIITLEGVPSERLNAAKLEEKQLELSYNLAMGAQQAELGDLFGNPRMEYFFSPDFEAPAVAYAGVDRSYEDLVVFGSLLKTEAATQLVGLDLGELGIKIDSWPRLRSYTSVPSLWSERNNGEENFGNLQDATIGNTVTWSTDFRGDRAMRQERAYARNDLLRERMDIEIQVRANRLMLLQGEGMILTEERNEALRQLKTLEKFESSPVMAIRVKANDATEALKLALVGLDDRIAEINMTFWTLDDSQWGDLDKFHDGIFALNL